MEKSVEFKSLVDDIVNNVVRIFSTDEFRFVIGDFVKKNYDKGLEKAETEIGLNFTRNVNNLNNLNKYSFELIRDLTDDMSSALRKSLMEGLLNQESGYQIKLRVEGIFKGKDLQVVDKNGNIRSIDWRDRLNTIVRTESVRAENQGHFDAVVQSGMEVKKYLSVHLDDRTSDICIEEHRLYGSEEQAIGMDEEFTVVVNGKTYSKQRPPFHPSCRSRLMFDYV